jgi:DNA-binding transcriptional LysR family regulator
MAKRQRYKDIQLAQLRSFCVAASHGNFTAAAGQLGLSAPTVWEQVRGLERHLGVTLMTRRGRMVELTADGRLLLQLIQPHVNGLDSLERIFEAQRAQQPGRVTIASTPYMLANHLVGAISQFMTEHPDACVNLRPSARMDDGIRLVERGQADLAILAYRSEEVLGSSLEFEHLFEMQLMLVTAKDHPLVKKKRVTARDIVQYPQITLPSGAPSRLALERILHRHNLKDQVRIAMESSHFDVICTYIAAGLGISLLYAAEDANWLVRDLHRRIFDPSLEGIPVGLIRRKGAHLSAAVEAFSAIVRRKLSSDASKKR